MSTTRRIDGRQNELTEAAIQAEQAEIRAVIQAVRNAERRQHWATRWYERFGKFPASYSPAAVLAEACEAIRRFANRKSAHAHAPSPETCELLVHPMFFRRPHHGSHGIEPIPRRRGFSKRTKSHNHSPEVA